MLGLLRLDGPSTASRPAEAAGLQTAFLVVAGLVLLSAQLCLRLPGSSVDPALWTGPPEPIPAVPSINGDT